MSKRIVHALVQVLLFGFTVSSVAYAQSAQALISEAANAMGGMAALRALKSQVTESEGKQFNSSLSPQPSEAVRQISSFRYSLTRDLTQPRVKLDWDGRNSARNENVRFVEVIDGSVGLLQEGDG